MSLASGCASSKTLERSGYRPCDIEIDRHYTKYEAIDKGRLYKAPKLVHYEKPEYPRLPKMAGIEGTVVIAVTIGTDGKVEDARIIASQVTSSMEKSVLNAAKKFTYRPGERRRKPVRCRGTHLIRFALNDDVMLSKDVIRTK
jgi:TonB family protein